MATIRRRRHWAIPIQSILSLAILFTILIHWNFLPNSPSDGGGVGTPILLPMPNYQHPALMTSVVSSPARSARSSRSNKLPQQEENQQQQQQQKQEKNQQEKKPPRLKQQSRQNQMQLHVSSSSPPAASPLLSLSSQQPAARFLMGIFTTVEEQSQRNLVRSALALYNDKRVCSFGSINGNLPPSKPPDGCQLIYTFVIGANPNGIKQIVKSGSDSSKLNLLLTKQPPAGLNLKLEPQNDMTFLNIQENVHEGKTPTWFHYASLVMSEYSIDYVIKSRSDTFLLVDEFLNKVAPTHFPGGGAAAASSAAKLVYAGDAVWSYPRRHIYMVGAWYLLSRDLAELMATKDVSKVQGIRRIEDADVGFCLLVRHQMVHMIALGEDKPWKHPNDNNIHDGDKNDNNNNKNDNSKKKKGSDVEALYRKWIEQETQRTKSLTMQR